MTFRADLEAGAEDGDEEAIAQLAALPPLPEGVDYLWDYFKDLDAVRQSTGFGPARWTRRGIVDELATVAISLRPWEVKALSALDALWIATYAKDQSGKK